MHFILIIIAIFIFAFYSTYGNIETYLSNGGEIIIKGIDNFSENSSSYGLGDELMPSLDFIEQYEYVDMKYYFRIDYQGPFHLESAEHVVIVGSYEESIYKQAKEYCFQKMQLSEINIIEYNGYIFAQNNKTEDSEEQFPHRFTMFAYNDELCHLAFMGFCDYNYTFNDTEEVLENWEVFLDKHFSDLYDFGM